MYTLTSNTSNSETSSGLQTECEELGRVTSPQYFRIVICCLNTLSLTFASLITKFFLLGGRDNRIML